MTLIRRSSRGLDSGDPVGRAAAIAPGSCGELVQGCIDGAYFLVTCPVNLYSRVSVALHRCARPLIKGPVNCPKSIAAVGATLAYLERPELGAELTVESALPRGKGMASSTADVAGAIFATASALGFVLTPVEIARLAVSIEPSDGIMLPGISISDYRNGGFHEGLGLPPPMEVVALDFGGTVDTLDFNSVDRRIALHEGEAGVKEALRLVREGVAGGDPYLVGEAATISATLNQRILFKPRLDQVLGLARSVGAVGVNAAHSGTIIGILLDRRAGRGTAVLDEARKRFVDLEASYLLELVGGGVSMMSDES